jgi:hypothetical protein
MASRATAAGISRAEAFRLIHASGSQLLEVLCKASLVREARTGAVVPGDLRRRALAWVNDTDLVRREEEGV